MRNTFGRERNDCYITNNNNCGRGEKEKESETDKSRRVYGVSDIRPGDKRDTRRRCVIVFPRVRRADGVFIADSGKAENLTISTCVRND